MKRPEKIKRVHMLPLWQSCEIAEWRRAQKIRMKIKKGLTVTWHWATVSLLLKTWRIAQEMSCIIWTFRWRKVSATGANTRVVLFSPTWSQWWIPSELPASLWGPFKWLPGKTPSPPFSDIWYFVNFRLYQLWYDSHSENSRPCTKKGQRSVQKKYVIKKWVLVITCKTFQEWCRKPKNCCWRVLFG